MTSRLPEAYRDVAEAAWRWVLDQVRWQDGPWIPWSVLESSLPVSSLPVSSGEAAGAGEAAGSEPPWDRDGTHSGIGGLGYVLAEIRLGRDWTAEEQTLADGIVERVRGVVPGQVDCTLFDGLVSTIGVLQVLGAEGAETVVARLAELAEPDGWPQSTYKPPTYLPGTRLQDVTIGTAGVLLGALWARRHGVAGGAAVAEHAAAALVAEGEALPTGTNWRMVPLRFGSSDRDAQMPNFAHGVAGVAAALAVAGAELGRPDLTAAARSGAEHLVSLGDSSGRGFVVPRYLPPDFNDQDEVTYTWCHGPTGTSLLFPALERAGVPDVGGLPPSSWQRRCLHSVRTSGLPARLHPGFWDNDGRCCGTAGVGDVLLDSWHRAGDDDDLAFALQLADTLVERVVRVGPHAYWRFLEHHAADPLLPPGVGWMQGAAGIAAFLFRASRVLRDGPRAEPVPRMDTWWAL